MTDSIIVLQETTRVVEVLAQGPQGPQGPQGGPGFTENVSISKNTPVMHLDATASGQTAELLYTSDNYGRWRLNKTSDSEIGANTGSHFEINRYSDIGGYLGTVIWASRNNGNVVVGSRTQVVGGAKLQTVDGLTFPTVAVLSSNATTLDEYREGTWTPTDVSGASLVFTSVSATYVKIGSLVYVNGQLTFPSTANLSGVTIGGLPYASAASLYHNLSLTIWQNLFTPLAQVLPASTTFGLSKQSDASSITNADMSLRTMYFSGAYRTN